MRWRHSLACLGLLALLPFNSGCAKLNEWLEGTVEEETEEGAKTPEEQLADAKDELATGSPADRKAAITTIAGIKLADALAVVIEHLDDSDPDVVEAALSGLQTVTGFPEKTEDERQLDPEGYDQQLAFKRQVVEQGLTKLAAALRVDDNDIRYGALIVFYNLGQAPVEPSDAKDRLRAFATTSIRKLALDTDVPVDLRLLAVDALVLYEASDEIATLTPLLDDPDESIRGRAAMAFGQVGIETGDVSARLNDLAGDPSQPWDVRWRAAAALGRLRSGDPGKLQQRFEPEVAEDTSIDPSEQPKDSPIEAYRAYALASSDSPEAAALVEELNSDMDAFATAAEEELIAERKKGYR